MLKAKIKNNKQENHKKKVIVKLNAIYNGNI